jgi:alkyldihydroxyacetonephosphate synthase
VTADALAAIDGFLPRDAWTTARAEREMRTRDWWPLTAVRRRRGDMGTVPDLVILPRSTAEVAAALRWATATRTAVIPRGGGSGVCGGVLVEDAHVAVLDLSRMDAVLDIDDTSQVVRVQAGIRGGVLETRLNERGLTLGHSPQSVELSSVGGWIATASAGQFTPGYGSIEDRLLGYVAVTGDGVELALRATPRTAAAPALRRLLLGTDGALAIVTEAALACALQPAQLVWHTFAFSDFNATLAWACQVQRARCGPDVLRGYDEADALRAFGAAFGHARGAVGLVGFPSDLPGLAGRLDAASAAAESAGARRLDDGLGPHWLGHRLDAVDVFERANGPDRALGDGAMLDTMEVAALWRDVPGLYHAVRAALAAAADDVRCHFSHVYGAGTALYFTFVLRATDDAALDGVYADVWERATTACLANGGTMTHHHGIGRLRADRIADELGAGAVTVLRRMKGALDPAGVLNPGALLPGRLER